MNWGDVLAILGGLAAGILSGFIGIGGGTAFVPIMTVGFRFNQALAQGTSLAAIIPTAITCCSGPLSGWVGEGWPGRSWGPCSRLMFPA